VSSLTEIVLVKGPLMPENYSMKSAERRKVQVINGGTVRFDRQKIWSLVIQTPASR
jgi:hypothetical protein